MMLNKSRKGISPLISAVILIAVTISVGAMVPSWSMDMFQDIQKDTSARTNTVADAASAQLEIVGSRYDNSFTNRNLSFVSHGANQGPGVDWDEDGSIDEVMYHNRATSKWYITDLDNETWITLPCDAFVDTNGGVGDIDEDGRKEVVYGYQYGLYACDSQGSEELIASSSRFGTAAGPVVDWDGNGLKDDIIFRNGSTGNFSVYDYSAGSVTKVLNIKLPRAVPQNARLADLDGDGNVSEFLFMDSDGANVRMFDMDDKSYSNIADIPKDISVPKGFWGPGDLDHDGRLNDYIIYDNGGSTPGKPWLFDYDRKKFYRISGNKYQGGGVADLDDDGYIDDFAGNSADQEGFDSGYSLVYTGSNEVSVSIRNSGDVEFQNVTVSLLIGDKPLGQITSGSVLEDKIKTLSLNGSKPTLIRAFSESMPVSDRTDVIKSVY